MEAPTPGSSDIVAETKFPCCPVEDHRRCFPPQHNPDKDSAHRNRGRLPSGLLVTALNRNLMSGIPRACRRDSTDDGIAADTYRGHVSTTKIAFKY